MAGRADIHRRAAALHGRAASDLGRFSGLKRMPRTRKQSCRLEGSANRTASRPGRPVPAQSNGHADVLAAQGKPHGAMPNYALQHGVFRQPDAPLLIRPRTIVTTSGQVNIWEGAVKGQRTSPGGAEPRTEYASPPGIWPPSAARCRCRPCAADPPTYRPKEPLRAVRRRSVP